MLTYLLLALNTLVDMKLGALTMLNLLSCCWKLTFIMHSETTSLQLSVLVFADRGLQGPWYRQGPEGTNGLSCPPTLPWPGTPPGPSTLAPAMTQQSWPPAFHSPARPWAPPSWVHILAWPWSMPTPTEALGAWGWGSSLCPPGLP